MKRNQLEVLPSEMELAKNLAAAVIAYQMGNAFSTIRRQIGKEDVGMYWVVLGRELVRDINRVHDAQNAEALKAVQQ